MKALICILILFVYQAQATSIWDQPSVWNQASEGGNRVQPKDLPVLANSGLTEDVQVALLQSCMKQGEEAKTFKLEQRYRITQVSDNQRIRDNCSGRLGETFCREDGLKEYLSSCVSERISNARVENALRNIQ